MGVIFVFFHDIVFEKNSPQQKIKTHMTIKETYRHTDRHVHVNAICPSFFEGEKKGGIYKNKYNCENYPHMKGLNNIFVKYMQSLNIHVPIQNYKISK